MKLSSLAAGLLLASIIAASSAFAKSPRLEEPPGEKDNLLACEKRLCGLVVDRPASGDDLKCALAKTWPRDTVNAGAQAASHMPATLGDARCSLPLQLSRAAIVGAVSQPEYTFQFPQHTVTCDVVMDERIEKVYVTLAPKIVFANGEARKVWVNLKKVDGPGGIKAMVWAAASLEDKLGLFHKTMLKEINKFLHKKCPAKAAKS
jgi:hypothetical protein